jgi:hypothetical protein
MGNNGPLQLFGDFQFVGGENTAPDYLQNAQTCINWYAEVDQQNPKEVLALLGCPGLVQLAAAPGGGAPGFITSASATILLMHFDGSNGSTVFTDSGPYNISFAVDLGSPQISTAQSKFGGASLQCDLTTGATQNGIMGHDSHLDIWLSDWTFECWLYWNGSHSGSFCCFGSSQPSGTSSFGNPVVDFVLDANGKPICYFIDNSGGNTGGNFLHNGVSPNTWTHVAFVRHNNVLTCYVGGVADSTTYALATSGLTGAIYCNPGSSRTFNANYWHQYIDEMRLSNAAIYTSNFTPPSAPFTSSGPTTINWANVSTVTNLPVRGTWELPNDTTALAVIGNTCYLVTIATPATSTSFATLALTSVGTLQTTYGPVHIRDNNIGGYAVIVDGPYGYFYNIKTRAFAQITDPAFLGADTVAFIDGWWIFNQPGTQTFYTNGVQYGITFNASNFALKDSSADNLVAVFENKEQLWLIGDKTTEIWYDAGGQYFAFQRLVGTPIQAGCKAKHSVARFSSVGQDGIMWFGRSERGENVIVRTKGFAIDVVSTAAFGDEVATYPVTSDAQAYTYQEDTHEFYMLTFPTADVTWCYDSQSGLLHKRLSYDPYLQQFHRHRSNCFMNFQGMRIVGDYQNGALYQLTRSVQTDAASWPIWARRRSPHIWDKGQRGRVFMASLQVDFKPGVGNASGLGVNPQAGLTISRDGGKTAGQRWPAPIGQIGQYKTRTMWRRLGFGRDNVVEIDVIDPVPRDITGVSLKAFSSA